THPSTVWPIPTTSRVTTSSLRASTPRPTSGCPSSTSSVRLGRLVTPSPSVASRLTPLRSSVVASRRKKQLPRLRPATTPPSLRTQLLPQQWKKPVAPWPPTSSSPHCARSSQETNRLHPFAGHSH